MDLTEITPLILAYNEHENIARCLEGLAWAKQVLVVDSCSTDDTAAICERFPNVQILSRPFDSLARQANFGLSHVRTQWVLSLDADYMVPSELVEEFESLAPGAKDRSYLIGFRYCVYGRPLRGTLYPPRRCLYRADAGIYKDDGHAHRFQIEGVPAILRHRIDHDDRKPLARWFQSQSQYAHLEAQKLLASPDSELRSTDKIRRFRVVAPFLNLFVTLFVRGCILDGPPGWFYSIQRFMAELMISACLLDHDLRKMSQA